MTENRKVRPVRDISIDDDGEAFQLAMYEDGQQVGGAYFPDPGDGSAHAAALEVGQIWLMGKAFRLGSILLH